MYKHHEESIRVLQTLFEGRDEVIALILGGSVAKGMERPDSDIDCIAVVTPEYYAQKKKDHRVAEIIHGKCTYPEGYFDVKHVTKDILQTAARQASEPTRNAYVGSRVLFSKDPEIAAIVAAIPVFQQSEQEEKLRVFYADLCLNHMYFWRLREENLFNKLNAACQIVYACYRIVLQENGVLFPCNRKMEGAVAACERKPENIVALANAFMTRLDDESADALVNATTGWMRYQPPEKLAAVQTKYIEYYETWWYAPRPLPHEW